MAGRTLVRRGVGSAVPRDSAGIPRPHYLDRPRASEAPQSSSSPPVKLHTDDWMQVELPRGDYVMAGLVALSIGVAVGSLLILPAMVLFNSFSLTNASLWGKLLLAVPVIAGGLSAWACLRRAKSDRIRQRLFDELRD